MPAPRILLLTLLAMLGFAGNSLLCRLALKEGALDAASFTSLRLLFGALTLWLLVRLAQRRLAGNWLSALALFLYAAAFSFAYLRLDTGTGALLLFGAVQVGMVVAGWRRGERLNRWQGAGFLLAIGGLLALLLPGASAPDLLGALLMALSGLAWALYSLRARNTADPLAVTAGNFLLAAPLALGLSLLQAAEVRWSGMGVFYAVVSGALTSGVCYAIWYSALRGLTAVQAGTVQLSVPILAALGGSLLLDEALSLRLALTALAVLGGIALMLRARPERSTQLNLLTVCLSQHDERRHSRWRMVMTQKFNVGDHVSWNSEAGRVSGKITKVHTRDTEYKGHPRHASEEEPQYEIKSDKTDHVAMHKGSALKKID